MGYNNDSSVRAFLNENTASNKNRAMQTAEILKGELAEKCAHDVGKGTELELRVSSGFPDEALFILETEGYNRYGIGVAQITNNRNRATIDVNRFRILFRMTITTI